MSFCKHLAICEPPMDGQSCPERKCFAAYEPSPVVVSKLREVRVEADLYCSMFDTLTLIADKTCEICGGTGDTHPDENIATPCPCILNAKLVIVK